MYLVIGGWISYTSNPDPPSLNPYPPPPSLNPYPLQPSGLETTAHVTKCSFCCHPFIQTKPCLIFFRGWGKIYLGGGLGVKLLKQHAKVSHVPIVTLNYTPYVRYFIITANWIRYTHTQYPEEVGHNHTKLQWHDTMGVHDFQHSPCIQLATYKLSLQSES